MLLALEVLVCATEPYLRPTAGAMTRHGVKGATSAPSPTIWQRHKFLLRADFEKVSQLTKVATKYKVRFLMDRFGTKGF